MTDPSTFAYCSFDHQVYYNKYFYRMTKTKYCIIETFEWDYLNINCYFDKNILIIKSKMPRNIDLILIRITVNLLKPG